MSATPTAARKGAARMNAAMDIPGGSINAPGNAERMGIGVNLAAPPVAASAFSRLPDFIDNLLRHFPGGAVEQVPFIILIRVHGFTFYCFALLGLAGKPRLIG